MVLAPVPTVNLFVSTVLMHCLGQYTKSNATISSSVLISQDVDLDFKAFTNQKQNSLTYADKAKH